MNQNDAELQRWFASLDRASAVYDSLIGILKWQDFTPSYSFTTATSLTVTGKMLIALGMCFVQVKSTGTSLQTTAGTSYITFPITGSGLTGFGVMTNDTAKTAVGTGHVDVANGKFYPPTQAASGNNFNFWFVFPVSV